MNELRIKDFYGVLKTFSDWEYLFYKIQYDIAPTLAGIKPSSLMTFHNHNRRLLSLWDRFKEEICKQLDIYYYELGRKNQRVMVLFYRDEGLANCLNIGKNRAFLVEQGYRERETIEESLSFLKERFQEECPHELGVFLGYPIEDVITFIESKGAPSLVCKYWKVYQNVENALKIFAAYDRERAKVINAVLQKQKRRKIA
ncbi:MAG: DUF3793 family protein [Desulfitobacterium sp.]|nr:DUF3793 family protein [Desulfitobacterium sp.]